MADLLSSTAKVIPAPEAPLPKSTPILYDQWAEALGLPIYQSFAIEDAANVPLGWWEERRCNAAVVKLVGLEGLTGIMLVEIPPGQTMAPSRMALDEAAFVLEGRGLASIWAEGRDKKTFEWAEDSLFMLPANHFSQLGNAQGDRPARLLLYNYLPVAMSVAGNADLFFKNTYVNTNLLYGEGSFYAEAKPIPRGNTGRRPGGYHWLGNFFPDLKVWDKLENQGYRGGGKSVALYFPNSNITSHMAVFPPGTYKKAHRHGPGVVIIVLEGEGYSLLWPQKGADMVMVRWKEGSLVVPPNKWWHQHFNAGTKPARYMALHAAKGIPGIESAIADNGDGAIAENQIEFPDEDPQIRRLYEAEVAKRGGRSLMPEEAYRDREYEFQML